MSDRLPDEATIRDVIPRLRDAEDYLCGVLRRMHEWLKTHQCESVFVSIGVMGKGVHPNYRLSRLFRDSGFIDQADAYEGRTHALFERQARNLFNETWSGTWTSQEEVLALLGEVRTSKRMRVKRVLT